MSRIRGKVYLADLRFSCGDDSLRPMRFVGETPLAPVMPEDGVTLEQILSTRRCVNCHA
ncbi:MAG: hypothetical protein MPJ50_09090 [Pirellulales bacterium]|nr:hypothetical protein [Pirellulales bacterium]